MSITRVVTTRVTTGIVPEVGDRVECDLGQQGPSHLKITLMGRKKVKLRYSTGKEIEMPRAWLDDQRDKSDWRKRQDKRRG